MKIEYSDYKQPHGTHAVVGGRVVIFDDAAVAALAANAMMLATGVTEIPASNQIPAAAR